MSQINTIFSKLRNDIRNARTKKALRVLQRRGLREMKRVNKSLASKSIKQEAKQEFMKAVNEIKLKSKQLN